ncbi:hypothetical protein HG535_0D03290 [Zygotorulaspora mrakii]|uniref:DNA replication regulator SLD2 n=1 Tax=Zygotorulaspora mrakii TaxID=42260 RepID=A0A7H9B1V7_ZYGMR|nr:uncharacterized protein HG535_0D03290 [Zygotorulaspora mrakii]QLG72621.1 hypothetical protein HG535_0D03290 [Zygotorulaspora mrakii]
MAPQIDELKIDLKKWEHSFIKDRGREPTKDDIKRLPDVKKLYKQYSALKKGNTSQDTKERVFAENRSPKKNLAASLESISLVELGPTPQIHGKAMSIFEMGISPIKQPNPMDETLDHPFAVVPTSKSGYFWSDRDDEKSVKRQLQFTDTIPNSSPFKNQQVHLRPKYYGPNSPLKLSDTNIELSLVQWQPIRGTPRKHKTDVNEINSFSPSPLVKRPLTKSLLELVQEQEAIVEEFKNMSAEHDSLMNLEQSTEPEELSEQETAGQGPSKPKRRILRRFAPAATHETVKRNISEELIKLKQRHVNEFYGNQVFAEPEESEQHEKDPNKAENTTVKKTVKRKNKKYNLVSNNFKRLRLPKKGSSKKFWGKRRR